MAKDKTVCLSCKKEFDFGAQPEVSLGVVKCSHCGTPVNQEGVMMSLGMETFDVEEKEIFRTGSFRTSSGKVVNIDDSILDNILEAFAGLPYKVPLKLGHSNDQKLLQKDGYPAAGWIKSLRRVGNSLKASFAKVPKVIKEFIEAGAYPFCSIELAADYHDPEQNKTYKNFLTAVALLGQDLPAVSTLQEWTQLYQGMFSNIPNTEMFEMLSQEEVNEMEKDLEKAQEQADQFKAQAETIATELKKAQSDLKDATEKYSAMVKTRGEEIQAATKTEMKAFIAGKVKDGKMLPVQAAYAEVILCSMGEKHKFSVDAKEVEMSLPEAFKAFVEALPKQVNFSTLSVEGEGVKTPDTKYAGADPNGIALHEFTMEIVAKDKIDYTTALRKASLEHPELTIPAAK